MQASSGAVPARDIAEALRTSLLGILNPITAAVPKLLGFAAMRVDDSFEEEEPLEHRSG